jgi:hypothetical protein
VRRQLSAREDFPAALPGARKDAARSFLQAARDYETSTTNVSLDLVSLYKALDG